MITRTVRNLVLGDNVPKICVPIVAYSEHELQSVLASLWGSSYDLLEFRADFYFDDPIAALSRIRESAGDVPVLFTIRTKEEGGEINMDLDTYAKLNLQAASMADLIDIQFERIREDLHLLDLLHDAGAVVVGSYHNFEKTPETDELVHIICEMQHAGFDITKAAVMPNDRTDVMKLIAASVRLAEGAADRPFVTVSMGEMGKITRVSGAFTGSCMTFAIAGETSAPGQVPADSLREVLRLLQYHS